MCIKIVKLDIKGKKCVNKTIQSTITSIISKELEIINATRMCDNESNKPKENSNTYDNQGEENTSSTSEKKEKECDGYVSMYSCGKHFYHSTNELTFTEKVIPISKM